MTSATTVFFSDILGKKIISPEGKTIGRLKDLVADLGFSRPKIVAAIVSTRDGLKTVDFSAFQITHEKGGPALTCKVIRPLNLKGMETFLVAGQLLNKKVVDMNRKKTILVYDLKIALQDTKATVAAVDAGMQGRLRRLGISNAAVRLMKLFDLSIPNQLVLWDNVEAVNFSHTDAGLSKSMTSLNRLHPSDMADIMEEMDHNTQMELFSAMDTERAADVLEELEPDTQDKLLGSLPADKIADVLEIMPVDEIADILDEIDEAKAEELLKEMDGEVSGEVRELMEYDDNEIGSLMTTDYLSFHGIDTVEATLQVLRLKKPEFDTIYYLYIVSEKGEFEAALSLRDIIVSSPDLKLGDIMNRDMVCVHDTDPIDLLNDIVSKYNLLAVPVVDANRILLGMVIINDILFSLLQSRRKLL